MVYYLFPAVSDLKCLFEIHRESMSGGSHFQFRFAQHFANGGKLVMGRYLLSRGIFRGAEEPTYTCSVCSYQALYINFGKHQRSYSLCSSLVRFIMLLIGKVHKTVNTVGKKNVAEFNSYPSTNYKPIIACGGEMKTRYIFLQELQWQ